MTVTGITVNTLIAPAIPDILAAFDVSEAWAGLLLAAATFPGILLAPAIGVLADRFGRRAALVPSLAVFAVAGGLGGVAPSFWTLVGLRLAQGAGSAGLINLAVVLIGDHWSGEERARTIGRNTAVLTVSLALLPPVGGALVDVAGWRAPFALYPLALLTAWGVSRRLPAGERRDVSLRAQLAAARPYLTSRTVGGVLATGVVVFAVLFGLVLTALPIFTEQRFGLSATARGVLLGLPAVTSTLAALSLGRVQPVVGRRRLLVGASALFPAALATVTAAPGIPLLVVGMLLLGVGEGLLVPGLQNVVAGVPPATSRGTVVAVWVGATRLGQTLGPVLASGGIGTVGIPATFVAGTAVAAAMPAILGLTLDRWGRPGGGRR